MIPQPEIIMILLNMQNKFILRKSGIEEEQTTQWSKEKG
jgi:hypothetical protein